MADEIADWKPVEEQEITDWAPVTQPTESKLPPGPLQMPAAFVNRLRQGETWDKLSKMVQKATGQIEGEERFQFWPEVLLRSALSAPGDVLSGKLPAQVIDEVSGELKTNPEMIERASDLAGLVMGTQFGKVLSGGPLLKKVDGLEHSYSRPHPNGDEVIGPLPREADFKQVADVLRNPAIEPPVPKDMVRLYRGETNLPKKELPDWLAENPDVQATIEATGRWFVGDRETALYYNTTFGDKSGRISYVDVPAAEVGKYLSANNPEAKRFSAAGREGEEYFLPKDIAAGRKELSDPTEVNLRRQWEQDGIHPAEALEDARNDAWNRNELTQKHTDPAIDLPPEAWTPEALAAEAEAVQPRSLGAAAVPEPPITPITPMAPSPLPGRLMAGFSELGGQIADIGKNLQMLTTPMVRGTTESMATVKDFQNSVRRNRWEWSRIDDDIAKRFTPEQRKRMWDAADEESVMRQEGRTSEHMGLATLEPAERAAVEDLQARAQIAWLKAVDLGMVQGEGLPAYTPRMVINVASALAEKPLALNAIGQNLKTRTAAMRHRKYLTAEETERAAKAKYGEEAELARDIRVLPLATAQLEDAIAGRSLMESIKDAGNRTGTDTVIEGHKPTGWFTLDHPAFFTKRVRMKDGEAVKDADGHAIVDNVPLYVRGDYEGPLRAALDHKSGAIYSALMSIKGKTMGLIMNSPLIHNAVEWGRAMPAMPGKVATFKVYFEGNRAKNNIPVMREAIDNGLVPIGKRFFNQDINAIMEAPDLQPGRSLTSQVLALVPDLFSETAGTAVKRAVDKAGDFWHNTLLWDRVADLQMGLYTNFQDSLMAKGIDRTTASRVAAHWANRYAGALPKEAMSDGATKIANFMMFSRSFTLGNLGVMKDMLTGLPKDVLAQIERDGGFKKGSIEGTTAEQQVGAFTKGMAQRKAISIVALDIGLMYVMNSLLQNMSNVMSGDSTIEQELHGYSERLSAALQERREHPLKLLQPFDFLESVSATSENEPERKDRVKIGNAADGTAIYARNPVGKIGEEFTGYMDGPLEMMRKKQGTLARPLMQLFANDKGFGQPIYNKNPEGITDRLNVAAQMAWHMFKSQFPENQIRAGIDLVKGEGDPTVAKLQAFGPVAGVTFSRGAPGGEAVGEMYHARSQHDFQVQMELPDIRKQIIRGDISGARERMLELGIPRPYQQWIEKTSLNPSLRLGSRALKDFYLYATPEQKERLDRARGR